MRLTVNVLIEKAVCLGTRDEASEQNDGYDVGQRCAEGRYASDCS